MDEKFERALAAGARAFADTYFGDSTEGVQAPVSGYTTRMRHVLAAVAEINDEHRRGATRKEMRTIAAAAGMDPRGMAGYYTGASQLLEKTSGQDARWITKQGRQRLKELGRS